MDSMLFEWLEEELASIKTPRFHVVDGPVGADFQDVILGSISALPVTYKKFVLRFGNARLYRSSRTGYHIGVFAAPRIAEVEGGQQIYHLGFHDGAAVYIKDRCASGVFEFEGGFEDEVAPTFEEWLTHSADEARGSYGKRGWIEILRGPEPFSPKELAVVEARRHIRWIDTGIDADDNHILKITNESRQCLAALTIGVRSKRGNLNGSVRIDISNIAPGKTKEIHVDCYKDLVPLAEVELFPLPDPRPEEREYYCELHNIETEPRRQPLAPKTAAGRYRPRNRRQRKR